MISNECINVTIEIQPPATIRMFKMEYFLTFKLEKLDKKAIFKMIL